MTDSYFRSGALVAIALALAGMSTTGWAAESAGEPDQSTAAPPAGPEAYSIDATATAVGGAAVTATEFAPDADDNAASGGSSAAPVRHHHTPRHVTVAQGIDDTVRRLSRGLELDPTQQSRLRQILWQEHQQLRASRINTAKPNVDRVALTSAIVERTKQQIREMLNEEQRKKYSADVPRDTLGASRSDLDHWLDVQQSARTGSGNPAN